MVATMPRPHPKQNPNYEYHKSCPPFTSSYEPTAKHCQYGGKVSAHLYLAGKELLRYEADELAIAQLFLRNLEWIGPRIYVPRKEWEVVVFHDSGFQTLSLSHTGDGPQVVLYHKGISEAQNMPTLVDRLVAARNAAARYSQWYNRRKRYEKEDGIAHILIALNMILDDKDAAGYIAKLCPEYHVQQGVSRFTMSPLQTKQEIPNVTTGSTGQAREC